MNVFLIPLQERISLSLLHPSLPCVFLSLSLLLYVHLFYPVFNFWFFFCFFIKYSFDMLHFVFSVMLIITLLKMPANYWFTDFAALISFSINLFINQFICSYSSFPNMLSYFRFFFLHFSTSNSVLSISLIYFLSNVSPFSFHSPGIPRRDWQRKGKRIRKVFLIESV